MRVWLGGALLGLGCAPAPRTEAPAAPPVAPRVVEVASARPEPAPALADAGEPANDADAASPSAEPPGPKQGDHRWPIAIDASHGPCTLVLRGSFFSESEQALIMSGVDRVSTEQSPGCAAGVLYDLASEKAAPDPPEPLAVGPIAKPGHLADASAEGPVGGLVEDLNFDGANDLCLTELTGAYNYSQRCWLFDPASRRFVRNGDLDELIFMEIDPKTRRLRSGHRVIGPIYVASESGWIKGKLVTLRLETSYVGETPNGKPLPGFVYHVIEERRGNRLVKVREGPVKNP